MAFITKGGVNTGPGKQSGPKLPDKKIKPAVKKTEPKLSIKQSKPKQIEKNLEYTLPEKLQLSQENIEFLLNIIKDGMIPGTDLQGAVETVYKLQEMYKWLDQENG